MYFLEFVLPTSSSISLITLDVVVWLLGKCKGCFKREFRSHWSSNFGACSRGPRAFTSRAQILGRQVCGSSLSGSAFVVLNSKSFKLAFYASIDKPNGDFVVYFWV